MSELIIIALLNYILLTYTKGPLIKCEVHVRYSNTATSNTHMSKLITVALLNYILMTQTKGPLIDLV